MRYWLPVANLAIDAALLGMLAWTIHVEAMHEKRPVAFSQGEQTVRWDVVTHCGPPPPQFYGLAGTLPAALISELIVPGAVGWTSISIRWVCLYESLGLLFWFGIGWVAEASLGRRVWVIGYLMLRVASVFPFMASACGRLMLLVWLGAVVWSVAASVRFLCAKWMRRLGV